MVEIHCFITLRESYKPDDEETERFLPIVQKEIDKVSCYGVELKVKNGEYYIEFSHFTNHKGQDFDELFNFFQSVGISAPGSYGLFYLHDDEDETKYNSFRVWRLAKGLVKEFKDFFLSPCIPTIEEYPEITDELLVDRLEQYTRYSKGDLSCKSDLIFEDINISQIDFSPYDLNNSYFLGVDFDECNFRNVYLSGSNFSGSSFTDCIFANNILRKAQWVFTSFLNTEVISLDAFRVQFDNVTITESVFRNSTFFGCDFSGYDEGCIENAEFYNCEFKQVQFKDCEFKNVRFINCSFNDTCFDDEIKNVTFINCTGI